MEKDYGNWCPEIYRGIFVDRFNDDKIRIAPCCQADSSLESIHDFDFKSNKFLSRLRSEFDQGNFPKECDKCWSVEKHGHKSRRISAIEFYDVPLQSCDIKLESLDHSTTWACNLACIMCGPSNSSAWAKELGYDQSRLKSIGKLYQKKNDIVDKLDLSTLKKLHFNGGEPLLNRDQDILLGKLDDNGLLPNLFISYNTNGTQRPSDKVMDYWSKTKLIKLFFSIDGIDSCFDYVRWPAKWQQVEDNILWMKKNLPSNVMFGFNVAVGTYNVLEVSQVYDWFVENLQTNREGDLSDFNWQVATGFDPKFLSTEAKYSAIESTSTIHSLCAYMKSALQDDADDSWISALENIDFRRGTDWKLSLKVSKYY